VRAGACPGRVAWCSAAGLTIAGRDIHSRLVKRLALLLLGLPGVAPAAVSFPEIRTLVEVSSDGSAHVVQELTCRFEGRPGTLCLTFPDRFRRGCISVNRLTERAEGRLVPVKGCEISDDDWGYGLRWHTRARDETRHYIIDLTVLHVARRYDDAAHLRIPIIGAVPGPVERATVEVRLPRASPGEFRLTDAAGTLGTIRPDRATGFLERSGMSKDERLYADVVTDPTLFADVPLRPGLMGDVESRARTGRDLRSPDWSEPAPRWSLALVPLLLPLALLLALYRLYGREPRVGCEGRYEREPPERIPPLAVPPITRQRPDVTEMPMETLDATLATLLDAARKGVLEVVPGEGPASHGRGFRLACPERRDDLDELSRTVLDYYFHDVSRGRELLTDRDIRQHSIEQPDAFLFWLRQMSQEGRDWWWRKLGVGFLEPRSLRAYRFFRLAAPILTGICWFAMPFGFSVFSFFTNLPLLMALFLASVAASVVAATHLGRVILRWSPPVYYEHLRWQSFRRFLVEFSALKQAPVELAPVWQEYYVYAVALGIGEKFMHGLSGLANAMERTVNLQQSRNDDPEALGIGWEPPRPRLDTRAAFGEGISQMLAAFRSGSGLQGKRRTRLQPSALRRSVKQ